jgi:hypothetical protein
LCSASNYAVLGLANASINNSLVTINGNEGISAGGTLSNQAPSTVNGNVYEAASGQLTNKGTVTGSTVVNSATLSQNDADAAAAVKAAEGLSVTQTLGSSSIITGNGGLNVIQVNGNISSSLTLTGTASDRFIVLVSGNLTLGGSDSLGVGGKVTAADVLYVFTGSNSSVTTHVGNVVNGTLLGLNTSYNLDGTFNGEIIGASNQSIGLLSGAIVNAVPFTPYTPPTSSVPEPSTMALFGSGLVIAGVAFRKRQRQPRSQQSI